ncbi:eukaryotic translation initiation factor 2 beta subunit, partial [Metarhizium majus ARSEF 297]
MVTATEEPKETAQSHTPRTPPLSAALGAFTDASAQAATDDAPPPADGGLDLSLMKKKKKKKVKKENEEDDFAAKLKQLEVKDAEDAAATAEEESGNMDAGTGIWAHDETKTIGYSLLLQRFFHQLSQKNPDHTLTGTKSFKIPPPQCMREGNRKTVFANIADICKRMKRTEDHLTAYLFAELGTNGSVDGNRRLVIKGRFQQKQIEGMVRKYISTLLSPSLYHQVEARIQNLSMFGSTDKPTVEYVTCKTCKSPDTELSKGENRLYFVTCNNCGSRRSVTAIKTGFSAQVGKRKKMQG